MLCDYLFGELVNLISANKSRKGMSVGQITSDSEALLLDLAAKIVLM